MTLRTTEGSCIGAKDRFCENIASSKFLFLPLQSVGAYSYYSPGSPISANFGVLEATHQASQVIYALPLA